MLDCPGKRVLKMVPTEIFMIFLLLALDPNFISAVFSHSQYPPLEGNKMMFSMRISPGHLEQMLLVPHQLPHTLGRVHSKVCFTL